MKPGAYAGLPVARYLRPEEAVVPFRSRSELDKLQRWCISEGHAAMRLIIGDGGAGKTRLALHLGHELAANGWQTLWVPLGSEREAVGAVREVGQPCMLVVDYAETRRDLVHLLDDVAADEDGPELRVILLARSAGEWWQQLRANVEERTAALLAADVVVPLGPVRAAGGMQEVFDDAIIAFADRLGVRRPDTKLTLSDPDPVILVVHAAALLAVIDYAIGLLPQQEAISASEVLEALLRHEARYWMRSATSRGLDLDLGVLRLAVALGCLIGAESETAAGALLANIPDLDSAERRGRLARWLHDLYPTAHDDDTRVQEWLGPLRPDLLAEQLIAGELARRSELIAPLFSGLSEARAGRALTVLARAALTQDRAVSLLRAALAADLDHLAVPALSVAIETNPVMGKLLSEIIQSQPVSRETLVRIGEESPYPSFALAEPAVIVFKRLAEDSADDKERAKWLIGLSNRLGELGWREEAMVATQEAAGIYRILAEARPDEFLDSFAMSLNNMSGRLDQLGRPEEALAAAKEAAGIYRILAEARPDEFLDSFAMSLSNQSLYLREIGRPEEALAAAEEAATLYRQLMHPLRPIEFYSYLAGTFSNQANCLAALGRREEALIAIEQATSIYFLVAEVRPDSYLPEVATSLLNQSVHLGALGRREKALATIEQATEFFRVLAEVRPDAYLSQFATSLLNQTARLAALGRREEAAAVAEEAVTIYRQLAEARPDAYLPGFAGSLVNQAVRLADSGQREEALATIEQATSIHRQLAEGRPDAYLPNLARSLNNQSVHLGELGRHDEGLARIGEAVDIYRALAEARPDAYLPDLAGSLLNQAVRLADSGRREEALAIAEEAVTIYRQLAEARPDAYLPELATSLYNHSLRLADSGRREEALATAEEAVTIYRQLAEARPDAYLPELATSLYNLANILTLVNRDAEALVIRQEADTTVNPSAQL